MTSTYAAGDWISTELNPRLGIRQKERGRGHALRKYSVEHHYGLTIPKFEKTKNEDETDSFNRGPKPIVTAGSGSFRRHILFEKAPSIFLRNMNPGLSLLIMPIVASRCTQTHL